MKKLMPEKVSYIGHPKIGQYTINAIRLEEIQNDKIVLIDYGVPKKFITILSERGYEVAVIDHHLTDLQEQKGVCNPVALGFPQKCFPSTTWVIYSEFISNIIEEENLKEIKLLVSAGIIGDVGFNVKDYSQKYFIKNTLEETGLSYDKLMEAVNIVDSCYRVLDDHCISRALHIALEKNIEGILNDSYLATRKICLENALSELEVNALNLKENGVFRTYSMENNLYITSMIGRKLAKENQDKIIVLYHYIPKLDLSYLYVRSLSYNVGECIGLLREKGFIVGGKDKVFVVSCEGRCENLISYIKNYLRRCMS